MYKAYYISKDNAYGYGQHAVLNRLGLFSKNEHILYTKYYFSLDIAQAECDYRNKEDTAHLCRVGQATLGEYEYFVAKAADLYQKKYSVPPNMEDVLRVYNGTGVVTNIISEESCCANNK